MDDREKNDPNFVNDLIESRKAVDIAAKWLSSKGYPVIIRPTYIRPVISDAAEYSDDGDLEIIQRVEVKRRININFKSKKDFPYQSVIVDACHCYDNAKQKPHAYIILNNDMDAALIVHVQSTINNWSKVSKFDRHKNRERSFYECPLDLVKLAKMGC